MRILIVGAGIAGLALARAFELRGITVDIVERRDTLRAPGAGLYLPGNATRAIDQLGLLPELRSHVVPIKRQLFLDSKGREVFGVDVDEVWHRAGACLSTRRSDLQDILQRSLRRTNLRYSRGLTSLRQPSPDSCEVTFEDGEQATYDLVIGADGINSSVRSLVISDRPPQYAGYQCWRFITRNTSKINCWTVMLGGDRTLLAIPLSQSDVYVYADLVVADGASPRGVDVSRLRSIFAGFDGPVTPLLNAADRQTDIHFGLIEQLRLHNWVKGRVVVMGDAAHASSPSMAEGAGMAMEDALVLAEEIHSKADIDTALRSYQLRRQERANWVQDQANARDKLRSLPAFARTTILKLIGARMYRRNYEPLLDPV